MSDLVPFAVKTLVATGIIIICISVVVLFYRIIKHQKIRPMIYVIVGGALISIAALILGFVVHFDIDYSSFKWQIPLSAIMGIVTFIVLTELQNKRGDD